MKRFPCRGSTHEGTVPFWDADTIGEASGSTDVTVLSKEIYYRVVYKGKTGLIKKDDLVLGRTKNRRAASLANVDINALQNEKQMTESGLTDQRLPSSQAPEARVEYDDNEKSLFENDLMLIEESVTSGFPIPQCLELDQLALLLTGVLTRPNGIKMAIELIKWAVPHPQLARQIPPLLPDLPGEVRDFFSDEASKFLSKSITTQNSEHEIYTQLFRASVGLPPDITDEHGDENLKESRYRLYGHMCSLQAGFHPDPVLEDEVNYIRAMLHEGDVLEKLKTQEYLTDRITNKLASRGENEKFVFTESTGKNVLTLCRALQSPIPLLLEGDTGTGKTVSVSVAASLLGKDHLRFNLSSGTTVEDLVGRMELDKKTLKLSLQPFTEAFSKGIILVLDECNLAQEEVLATLESALDTGILVVPNPSNPARASKEIKKHPSFRLIITQNPCTGLYRGKRHTLSAAFLSRFYPVALADVSNAELAEIATTQLTARLGCDTVLESGERFWHSVGTAIVRVHAAVKTFTTESVRDVSSLNILSIRDVINFVKLIAAVDKSDPTPEKLLHSVKRRFPEAAWCLYRSRFQKDYRKLVWKAIRESVKDFIEDIADDPTENPVETFQTDINADGELVRKRLELPKLGKRIVCSDDTIASPQHPIVATERILKLWKQLDFVIELRRPVLVVGSPGSGTSSAVLGYAAYRRSKFNLCHVTTETTAATLIGQNMPCVVPGEDKVCEWIDGPATSAIDLGRWLVLDDLPAATATVLERLNSLLEEEAELYVAERGDGKTKKIIGTPSFRVLATADVTQIASISPAFANRFTVLFFEDPHKDPKPEISCLLKSLLFAPSDLTWLRRGEGEMEAFRNQIRHCGEEDKYLNAIIDREITEDQTYVVQCKGVNGACVGVAIDDEKLPLTSEPHRAATPIWGYSNHGEIFRTQEGKPRSGTECKKFNDGDLVSIIISCSKETITFSLNDEIQKCIPLTNAINQKKPLRPFVGLFTKGSTATIKLCGSKQATDDEISQVTSMALQLFQNSGQWGLATVVRALQVARKLADDQGVLCEKHHLVKALTIAQLVEQKGSTWFSRRGSSQQVIQGFGQVRGGPALRAALERRSQNMPPSLHETTHRVVRCISVSLPLVIIDDYGWDFEAWMPADCEHIIATPNSSLSEWFGTLLPTTSQSGGVQIKVNPGPLSRALNEGKLLLLEGLGVLPPSAQSQLVPLLETGMLCRPGEGESVRAQPGFSFTGICTSKEVGRLPKKFQSKLTKIHLPRPKAEDYKSLVGDIPEPSATIISKAAAAIGEQQNRVFQMNIRVFKRVIHRMNVLKIANDATISPHLLWGYCYASYVLSPCQLEQETCTTLIKIFQDNEVVDADKGFDQFVTSIKKPSSITVDPVDKTNIVFTCWNLKAAIKGSITKHKKLLSLRALRDTVIAIAHGAVCGEATLLVGPTSCKTLALQTYSSMISQSQKLEVVHLTCSTDESDLLGSVLPYSPKEYRKEIELEREMLKNRLDHEPECTDSFAGWTEAMKRMEVNLESTKGDEGSTLFAFKDGPLSLAVKRGNGILLKAANLPSESIYVSLMKLFISRELTFGAAIPTIIPLSKSAPLVLTITSDVKQGRPPTLDTLCVHRLCPAYEPSAIAEIIADAVSGDEQESDESVLVSKTIQNAATRLSLSLRSMLRWARFVNEYSKIAKISKLQAFVLGGLYLLQVDIPSDSCLRDDKWTDDQIKSAKSIIPAELISKGLPIKKLVELKGDTAILKDGDGAMLAVARCYKPDELSKRLERSKMVPTISLLRNLCCVFAASTLRIPLLLEGAPGIGKSFIVQSAATLLACKFERIPFSAGTTLAHLFGAPMPVMKGGVRKFEPRLGILGEALRKGETEDVECWILFDELNLAPPEVQQALSPMLTEGATKLTIGSDTYNLERVRCFAAVNPAKVGGGRSHLPPSVRDLFTTVALNELTCEEAIEIIEHKLKSELDFGTNTELQNGILKEISAIHKGVSDALHNGSIGGDGNTRLVNLRTLEKVVLLLASRLGTNAAKSLKLVPEGKMVGHIRQFFIQIMNTVYKWRFRSPADRAKVSEIITNSVSITPGYPHIAAMGFGSVIMFERVGMLRGYAASASKPLPPSAELRDRLSALAAASVSSLAVLLEGPTASGKTALVRELSRICGQKLQIIPITPNTEIGELLGMWIPCAGYGGTETGYQLGQEVARLAAIFTTNSTNSGSEEAKVIKSKLATHLEVLADVKKRGSDFEILKKSSSELCSLMSKLNERSVAVKAEKLKELQESAGDMGFHFAESQLVHAMHEGDWVLLDNIDWATPAAIERLNSLLEADATFRLAERGEDEPVLVKGHGIHENFRMFFTANPARKHASALSTAFYNRVITLAMHPLGQETEETSVQRLGASDGDTCIPSILYQSFSPLCRDIKFWQYVATAFHNKARDIDPKISVRTLQQCLDKWKVEISTSAEQSSLQLLCNVLLSTYVKSLPPASQGCLIKAMRTVLTEAQVLYWDKHPKKNSAKQPRKSRATASEDDDDDDYRNEDYSFPQITDTNPKEDVTDTAAAEDEIDILQSELSIHQQQVEERAISAEETKKIQEACISQVKGGQSILEKESTGEYTALGSREELMDLAQVLERMWREKQYGIVEELRDNLSFPADVSDPNEKLGVIAQSLAEKHGETFPSLTPIHLLVLRLYTMEWADIDDLLGYENVTPWREDLNEEDKQKWETYKATYKGKRNTNIYGDINYALRMIQTSKDEAVRLEAKMTVQKWIKFICIMVTMCEPCGPPVLYRNIKNVDPKALAAMSALDVGDVQAWAGATSTAMVMTESFLGDNPEGNVTFILTGVSRGMRIDRISAFPGEEEVLLPPFTIFKVKKKAYQGPKTLNVELTTPELLWWDDPSLRSFIENIIHDCSDGIRRLNATSSKLLGAKEVLAPLNAKRDLSDRWSAVFSPENATHLTEKQTPPAATVEYITEEKVIVECIQGLTVMASNSIGSYYSNKEVLKKASSQISEPAHNLFSTVNENLTDALRNMMQNNMFTRYQAASSGVELYIPGLIKAITTNFSFNKVFASRTAGGTRSYSCILAVDVSIVDDVEKAIQYLQIFASLRNSLSEIEVEPAVVVFNKSSISCVHLGGSPWNDVSSLAFLTTIDELSNDVSAEGNPLQSLVSLAVDMKGKKKSVFVITTGDSFSWRNPEIAGTLRLAEMNLIDVAGIGIDAGVHFALPRAVSTATAAGLVKGLDLLMHGPWKGPQSNIGRTEVNEKDTIWGRYHSDYKIDGHSATFTLTDTSLGAKCCVIFSKDLVDSKEHHFHVETQKDFFVGIGSNSVRSVDSFENNMNAAVRKFSKSRTVTVSYSNSNGSPTVTIDSEELPVPELVANAYYIIGLTADGVVSLSSIGQVGDEEGTKAQSERLKWSSPTLDHTVSEGKISFSLKERGTLNFQTDAFNQLAFKIPPVSEIKTTVMVCGVGDTAESTLIGVQHYGNRRFLTDYVGEVNESPLKVIDRLSSEIEGLRLNGSLDMRPINPPDKPVCIEYEELRPEDAFATTLGYHFFPTHEATTVQKTSGKHQWRILYSATEKHSDLNSFEFLLSNSENNLHKRILYNSKTIQESDIGDSNPPPARDIKDDPHLTIRWDASTPQQTFQIVSSSRLIEYTGENITLNLKYSGALPKDDPDTLIIKKVKWVGIEKKGWSRLGKELTAVDGQTITATKNTYSAALGQPISSGIFEWTVSLSNGVNGTCVGIATSEVDLDSPLYRKETTWVYSNHGKASHGTDSSTNKGFSKDCSVKCVLDMDIGSLVFYYEGVVQPKGFEGITGTVYPIVGLYTKGSRATMTEPVSTHQQLKWDVLGSMSVEGQNNGGYIARCTSDSTCQTSFPWDDKPFVIHVRTGDKHQLVLDGLEPNFLSGDRGRYLITNDLVPTRRTYVTTPDGVKLWHVDPEMFTLSMSGGSCEIQHVSKPKGFTEPTWEINTLGDQIPYEPEAGWKVAVTKVELKTLNYQVCFSSNTETATNGSFVGVVTNYNPSMFDCELTTQSIQTILSSGVFYSNYGIFREYGGPGKRTSPFINTGTFALSMTYSNSKLKFRVGNKATMASQMADEPYVHIVIITRSSDVIVHPINWEEFPHLIS
eukprot:TRINITY_DN1748_c0_g2_i1.p1 TRINITY_DN1748_c0_g2~~TRINITY_DN1748_c0_g2_i1.p1  ORF type:complete len:4122 (+),score=700.79 TRINITY_DN1748_c0_g2_i1:55-12420(+)